MGKIFGKVKDSVSGIIWLAIGIILIIAGVAFVGILPLAIILWVVGLSRVIVGFRILIDTFKREKGSSSRSSSSSYSSSEDYIDSSATNEELSSSDIRDAVVGMSNGYVSVYDASVVKNSTNNFTVYITLEKLSGWEGPYNNSEYREGAEKMIDEVSDKLSSMGCNGRVTCEWR